MKARSIACLEYPLAPRPWFLSGRAARQARSELAELKDRELVILSQERRISNELLEVVKQGSLKMLHDQISFVLRVSSVVISAYTIVKMEEIARK